LLQCRKVIRYTRRKVVSICKRQRYLIVAMGAIMTLWVAAEYVSPRDKAYGMLCVSDKYTLGYSHSIGDKSPLFECEWLYSCPPTYHCVSCCVTSSLCHDFSCKSSLHWKFWNQMYREHRVSGARAVLLSRPFASKPS